MRHDTYEMMHDSLRNIILNKPSISGAEAKESLWDRLKGSEEVFRLLFDNWFNANWFRYETDVSENNVVITKRTYQNDKDASVKRKIVAKSILKEKAGMILMNLPMPNGKILKDCTGSECGKFGGWFSTIAKKLKPTQKVGNKLSETDLQNLYMRNAA